MGKGREGMGKGREGMGKGRTGKCAYVHCYLLYTPGDWDISLNLLKSMYKFRALQNLI